MILSQSYIQLLAAALFRALIMEQEKLSLLFSLNMAWCMTLFRGALQLHFFGRNCAARLLCYEKEKSPAIVFLSPVAMSVGHGISIFGRRGLNDSSKEIQLEKREANDRTTKITLSR